MGPHSYTRTDARADCTLRKGHGHSKRVRIHKSRRESSGETNLDLELPGSRTVSNQFLLGKPPSL